MSVVRYLVDVSALARYPQPEVAKWLDELSAAGVVGTCSLMELELLSVVRDAGTYARAAALRRAAVEVLEMTEADIQRALEIQAVLVGRGEFGAPWIALLVAAVAERCGVVVLHYRPQKAIVATGNAILVIVYHLLSDPTAQFHDLGADYFTTRIDNNRRARNLAAALQAVTGQKITIRDGQAIIEAQAA